MGASGGNAKRETRNAKRGLLAVAALVLATVLVRVPTFRLPLDQDGSVFAYVAKTWADGGLPYRDAWDHKPPLTYLVYRGLFLFGPATGPGVNLTLRVGSALCDAAAAVLLFLLARRLFGFRTGVVAGLVYAVFAGAPILQLEAFQPERLAVLCTIGGVLAAVAYADSRKYGHAAASGLLFGLGLIAKQIVAPVGVLVWAWVTWEAFRAGSGDPKSETRNRGGASKRVVIHSVLMLAGAVLPWGLCAAYFAARGAFGDFWECTWRFNLFYAEEHRKGSLLAGAARAVKAMQYHHPFLWLAGVGGVAFALARPAVRRWGILLLGWTLVAFAALILPGQFAYYYYLPTVAPLAVACGVALAGLWQSARASTLGAVGAGAVVLVLLAPLGLGAWQSYDKFRQRCDPKETDVVVAEVAREIREKLKDHPDARIYMRGGRPQVYALSGRRNICPYLYDFHYRLPPGDAYHYRPDKLQAIVRAMDKEKPPYLVVTMRGTSKEGGVFDGAYEYFSARKDPDPTKAHEAYFPEFKARYLEGEDAPYVLESIREATPLSLRVYRRKDFR